MVSFDDIGAIQVGDGAGQLENTVEGAGGEVELLHGGTQQALCWRLDLAKFPDLHGCHLGIADKFGALEPFLLNLSGGFDTAAYLIRAFAHRIIGKLFVFHTGDFYEDVDAIQERAAKPLLITRDFSGGAFAFLDRVSEIATGAGVHGGDQRCV